MKSFDLPTGASTASLHRRTPVIFEILPGATNSSVQTELCGLLTAGTTELIVLAQTGSTDLYELPECVHTLSNLVSIHFRSIIVRGNETHNDPYDRIYSLMSPSQVANTNLALQSCVFLTNIEHTAIFDWEVIFNKVRGIIYLFFSDMDLGGPGLPDELPEFLKTLHMTNCGLVGSLPDDMLEEIEVDEFSLTLSGNELVGAIPDDWFDSATLKTLTLVLSHNNISGTIPEDLLSSAFGGSTTSVYVDLSGNQLDGPLSNLFHDEPLPSGLKSLYVAVSGNKGIRGSVPVWLPNHCQISAFTLLASGCSLTNTIPNLLEGLGCVPDVAVKIDLSNNQLEGALSSAFWSLDGGSTTTSIGWEVSLANNRLTGSATSLFNGIITNRNTSPQTFKLGGNRFTGGLPTTLPQLRSVPSNTRTVTLEIDFSGNTLMTGSITSNSLSSFTSGMDGDTKASSLHLIIDVSNTSLTGALQIPDLSSANRLNLSILASETKFTSFDVHDTATSPLYELDLSNNDLLASINLTNLFTNSPRLTSFNASNTIINDVMPPATVLSTTQLKVLDLSSTEIDFCSGTRSGWASSTLESCSLNPSAVPCRDHYPSTCSYATPMDPSLYAPASESGPAPCSLPTRPSPAFQCIGNVWTFNGTFTPTTLIIPSGSSHVVINGNLTSTTVLINGLGSTLTVNGCATNLTTVTIQLTEEQVKRLGSTRTLQTLVELSNTSSCVGNLARVAIEAKVTRGCRRVKAERQVSSNGMILSSFFSVDSSGCTRWWIILVSVVCGVIGLVVVFFVLLTLLSPKFREWIRPFSQRRGYRATAP